LFKVKTNSIKILHQWLYEISIQLAG
jgi:hypothetical protein